MRPAPAGRRPASPGYLPSSFFFSSFLAGAFLASAFFFSSAFFFAGAFFAAAFFWSFFASAFFGSAFLGSGACAMVSGACWLPSQGVPPAARDDVIAAAFLVGMAHGARGSDPKVEAASLAVAEVQPRVAAAGVEAGAADRDRD